jgi:sulfur carrier protein
MLVTINGEDIHFSKSLTISDFLKEKDIASDTVVVELNRQIIPTEAYENTFFNDKDSLEILRFVGGG